MKLFLADDSFLFLFVVKPTVCVWVLLLLKLCVAASLGQISLEKLILDLNETNLAKQRLNKLLAYHVIMHFTLTIINDILL